MLTIGIETNNGVVIAVLGMALISGYSTYTFCQYDDNGVPSISQENIDAFNELLTTDEWCYFGYPDAGFTITESQFDTIDKFVKSVSGVQWTDLYIKEVGGWVKQRVQKCSQILNDSGYITSKDVFKKTIRLEGSSDEYYLSVEEPNVLYVIESSSVIISDILQFNPDEMFKVGIMTSGSVDTSRLYVLWKNNTEPVDIGSKLVFLTYTGIGNTFFGECHLLEKSGVDVEMTGASGSISFGSLGGSLKIGRMQVYSASGYPRDIPISDSYQLESDEVPRFFIFTKSLPDYAFRNNNLIDVVGISDSNIGVRSFAGCDVLRDVHFHSLDGKRHSVSSYAFEGSKNIKRVFESSPGALCYYDFDFFSSNPLLAGNGELWSSSGYYMKVVDLVIPETITKIGSASYCGCKSIESVVIPKTVETISTRAFSGCSNLKNIVLNEGVKAIEKNAFENCTSLQSLDLPNSVTQFNETAIDGCENLDSLRLGDGISSISYSMSLKHYNSLFVGNGVSFINNIFNNNDRLVHFAIGNGLSKIQNSFNNCSLLESVTFDNSKKKFTLDYDSFENCPAFKKVYISSIENWVATEMRRFPVEKDAELYLKGQLITDLVIPEGVTEIKEHVFENCSSISSIQIPSTLIKVENCFWKCTNLTGVYVDSISTWLGIDFTDMQIGGSTELISQPLFYAHNLYVGNNLVTDLVIPEGVERIGDNAFYNCTPLTSVNIPESCKSVGYQAFFGCHNLERLIAKDIYSWLNMGKRPYFIKQIYRLFFGETEVLDLIIPEGVTSIPEYAFYNCDSLEIIHIPLSVNSIGDRAFSGCNKLEYVVFGSHTEVPAVGTSVFGNARIVVPDNLYDEWIASENWSDYASQIIKASEYVEPTNE